MPTSRFTSGHPRPTPSEVVLDVRIDRSSPVPMYFQLAEQLRAAIADGQLSPGETVETEVSMSERLRLSRPTGRKAMQEMVQQGLLVRKRGLGTIVCSPTPQRRDRLDGLFDDLQLSGRHPQTSVLDMTVGPEPRAAAALRLWSDEPVLALRRIRLADNQPLAVMLNWLHPARFDLSADDLESQGLYDLLRLRGHEPEAAQQRVGARIATESESTLLQAPRGEPVLTLFRTAFDHDGTPLEVGEHCVLASRYELEQSI